MTDRSYYNVKYCKKCSDRISLSQHILYDKTCFRCLGDIIDAEKESKRKEIEKLKKDIKWDD